MQVFHVHNKSKRPNRFLYLIKLAGFLCLLYLVLFSLNIAPSFKHLRFSSSSDDDPSLPTTLKHIVFGVASNEKSWPNRKEYVKLWWKPQEMRGCVFLETGPPSYNESQPSDLPPICISEDTAKFPYTFQHGLRSAIRVARVVVETVALGHSNVRWFVFGDDDTVFFPDNLVKTLSKYDHGLWYYIGTNSESFMQNKEFSYNMAFGGAGFAISYPLAKVLAKVFDSCLNRYKHLWGSDGRIYSCLSELGITLTHEPGFHQLDVRGNIFGLLAAHPIRPLVSLHHLDAMHPIFPNLTTLKSIEHLFEAVKLDPHRVMQQTVCYDRWFSWTISVSWGYAVQIFPHNVFLPDVVRAQETYGSWKKGGVAEFYDVDTLGYSPDPCRRPAVYFLDYVSSQGNGVKSTYRKMTHENCMIDRASTRKFEEIVVLSHKQDLETKQLHAPRRQCCDVLPSSKDNVMEIGIRECKDDELINMH